jgi:hypothetical protein
VSPDRESAELERGVIDRIEGEWAVVLVGEKEQERRVRVDDLSDGAGEGSIVSVRVSGLRVDVVATHEADTDEKRAEMQDRLGRLKRTRSSGRFNKPRGRGAG